MSYEQKTDSDKELSEIRREVIEARNLIIKTDHLLKTLHAEVKIIGKRNEDSQKRQWVSSALAYVLFVVLCSAAGLAFSSARTSSMSSERARLEKRVLELSAQVEKSKVDSFASQSAERNAEQVYRMMTAPPGEERLKGIDALARLDTSRLTGLEKVALSDRATQLRKETGQAALERGKSAFRRNDYAAAAMELKRFMAMNPEHQDLIEASFFLGVSLDSIKKYDEAIPALSRFVAEDKHARTRDFAMLTLAHALEQTAQLDKAAEVAREALANYPNSQFAPQLRQRLSAIRHEQPASATGTPGPSSPSLTPAAAAAAKPAH